MSLVINHNLMAANVAGHLSGHYSRLRSSLQRLSSGLAINGAVDDAAGLAIRELMRSDIASLHQGVRNANDAISLIQVADGALAVIDEKLIRMKELAEQAATGTYNTTQRLMINSEFQAMADEIDRIARSTEFNGIHLLDGSLSGAHDGGGLEATGAMKIHFGTANDSAEDYYYISVDDCSTIGLGLQETKSGASSGSGGIAPAAPSIGEGSLEDKGFIRPPLNDQSTYTSIAAPADIPLLTSVMPNQGEWYLSMNGSNNLCWNFMALIPAGSRNVIINQAGTQPGGNGDNDLQLFTRDGKHLAGTPLDDIVFNVANTQYKVDTSIDGNSNRLGFSSADYDASYVNYGPRLWDEGRTLNFTTYNGMTIGWSGDGERYDKGPNDGTISSISDYELLTIDYVTEDLIIWNPGLAPGFIQYYIDYQGPPEPPPAALPDYGTFPTDWQNPGSGSQAKGLIGIETQEKAQKALVTIDEAIVKKDNIRAHLGALQNRFENTVSNLTIQAENLQTAESAISDTDIAAEMTNFVKTQILTQASVAMLGQANSLQELALQLLSG